MHKVDEFMNTVIDVINPHIIGILLMNLGVIKYTDINESEIHILLLT